MKRILWASNLLTLSVLVLISIKCLKYRKDLQSNEHRCAYELGRFDFHYKHETDSPAIIMLGNSIIRYGNWDSLLDRKDVINRGIGGDKLNCICERLSYIKSSKAKIVFIEGGINDIAGHALVNTDTLLSYYEQIVNFLLAEKKIPVVDFVLYESPKADTSFPSPTDYKTTNLIAKELNKKLQIFVVQNKIDHIDLNPTICDTIQLRLKDEYTIDGVHLTNEAYKKWAGQIKTILNQHKI